jgi:hypothetical protein
LLPLRCFCASSDVRSGGRIHHLSANHSGETAAHFNRLCTFVPSTLLHRRIQVLDMNRRAAPFAVVLSVVSLAAAMVLVAQTQRHALMLLDPSIDDISAAFSETDRASQVLSKEGGLSLTGRDYQASRLSRRRS